MIDDQTAAQDPNELFDIVKADGTPTGRTKRRADVHRDGDWHRAVHVWVVGVDKHGPFLTLQRRSFAKDTSPGQMDATVGGHYRAGEELAETLREVEEEIGVAVQLADLHYAGKRLCINERAPGVIDREVQDVFFLRDERALTAFRPNPAELAALIRVSLADLLDFLAGEGESLPARSAAPGSSLIEPIALTRPEFTLSGDRYLYRVAIAAARFLAGERHFSV